MEEGSGDFIRSSHLGNGNGKYRIFRKIEQACLARKWLLVTDNAYVKILVEEGIIGLALVLTLVFCLARDILRGLKASDVNCSKQICIGVLLVFLLRTGHLVLF